MESEKVKEIKKALEFMMKLDLSNKLPYIDGYTPKQIAYEEIFNYINELESENEKLNSRCRNLEINYNGIWEHYREYEVENQKLKYRIVELEHKCDDCAGCTQWKCDCANIKTEALEQFAERLREKLVINNEENYEYFDYQFTLETIDETLKEFLSGSGKPNN